jgi:hypothetical protein
LVIRVPLKFIITKLSPVRAVLCQIKKANTRVWSTGFVKSAVFSPFQTREAEAFQLLPYRPLFIAESFRTKWLGEVQYNSYTIVSLYKSREMGAIDTGSTKW